MFKELRSQAVANVSINDIFEMKYYNQGSQVQFFQVISKKTSQLVKYRFGRIYSNITPKAA